MRFKLLSLFIACFILNTTAGKKPFVISKDPFGTRVFIENKGQFDNAIRVAEKVFYGYENGGEKIYFTNTSQLGATTGTVYTWWVMETAPPTLTLTEAEYHLTVLRPTPLREFIQWC